MSNSRIRLAFICIFVLNCFIWSRSRYGQPTQASLHATSGPSLVRRISLELSQPRGSFSAEECAPLQYPLDSQCEHVEASCPASETVLGIRYLQNYFCTDVTLRPLMFSGLVIWAIFLFSTLGISASDFFIPNLSTISQLLGLDENVAGVTLLAFGNGSPDVFSTFSAMRANSGSLAIGELLGAATFIVSCVVGSMCIIKPFQVRRGPFLRDVGFFALAVTMVLVTLWDGVFSTIEAAILVGLYMLYVNIVIASTWWQKRRDEKRHRELQNRSEYAEEAFEPYTDNPEVPTLVLSSPTSPRTRAVSAPTPPRLHTDLTPHHHDHRAYSRSPSPGRITQLPSFSLVGALEFRDVVASLRKEAAGQSLDMFDSPVTPFAGGHYHTPLHPRRSPLSSMHSSMDEDALNNVMLGERSRPRGTSPNSDVTLRPQQPPRRDYLAPDDNDEDYFGSNVRMSQSMPTILRTPASPTATISEVDTEEALYTPYTRTERIKDILRTAAHILFPTLHTVHKQTVLAQLACILAAPAVLALTLTLPVVVTPYDDRHLSPEKPHTTDPRLIDFEEEGMERILTAEDVVEEDMHDLKYNKWLMAAQCICGPLFCAKVLFDGTDHEFWIMMGTLIAGLGAGALVLVFSENGRSTTSRLTRCSMGFFVAIIWIMAIADEVVNVLQTFGVIFGLSDSIIGLTIFAVGNSLADLVANMSVAAFAPIMGFSACFGGPMLNILLGVGVSGSYIIHQTSEPYELELTTTLLVSSIGLLFLLAATAIFVPLNDYYLTRRWGIFLIATYAIIMTINIIFELKHAT